MQLIFQNLKILDNIEIYSDERVINNSENKNTSYLENYKKEDDSFGLTLNNFNGNINTTYKHGCELQRKRIECAIMIKAAMAE